MEDQRPRSGILTAGGVLAIIAGALSVLWGIGLIIAGLGLFGVHFPPMDSYEITMAPVPLIVGGAVILALSVLSILGGAYALGRRSWGMALTGGICSLLIGGVLGILALVFIAISREQFP